MPLYFLAIISLSFLIFFAGCASRSYVRHLASDACLIVPQQSTAKETLSLLGQPDEKRNLSDGTEEWIYFENQKSLLRKMPYLGPKLGYENFDLVIVHVKGEIVSSCTYRRLTEEEFKDSGIKSDHQLNAK